MIPFFVVTEDSQSQRIAHEGVAEKEGGCGVGIYTCDTKGLLAY